MERNTTATASLKEAIRRAIESGLSATQIAKNAGIQTSVITRFLDDNDVKKKKSITLKNADKIGRVIGWPVMLPPRTVYRVSSKRRQPVRAVQWSGGILWVNYGDPYELPQSDGGWPLRE